MNINNIDNSEDKWIKVLKNKVEDVNVDLPADGFERVMQGLHKVPVSSINSKRTGGLSKIFYYSAAAVIILLLIPAAILMFNRGDDSRISDSDNIQANVITKDNNTNVGNDNNITDGTSSNPDNNINSNGSTNIGNSNTVNSDTNTGNGEINSNANSGSNTGNNNGTNSSIAGKNIADNSIANNIGSKYTANNSTDTGIIGNNTDRNNIAGKTIADNSSGNRGFAVLDRSGKNDIIIAMSNNIPVGKATSLKERGFIAVNTNNIPKVRSYRDSSVDDEWWNKDGIYEKAKSKNFSIGFSAGNSTLKSDITSVPMDEAPLYDYVASSTPIAYSSSINDALEVKRFDPVIDYEYNHYQPLRFGILAAKSITDNIYVESGVNYTFMKSKIKSGSNIMTQHLNYIGIPLNFNWNFVNTKYMHLYSGVGCSINRCIYGTIGSKKVNINKFEFYSNIQVGILFNITNKIGIYFQPGVQIQFNNGKIGEYNNIEIKNYYSDKDLSVTLDAGFKFFF